MRRVYLLVIAISLFCNIGFGQSIDLVVDQSQSSAMFEVVGITDSSSVSGSGAIELTPIAPPFSTGQLTELDLTLADGIDISFIGGLVSIEAAPGSVMISLTIPGPAGAVTAGQFDQLGNLVEMEGIVEIFDPFNLAGGSATFNLADFGPINVDFTGVQLNVSGQDLTVSADLNLALDANGNAVSVNASILTNGVLPTVLLGDVNLDGTVNLLDVQPFIDLLASGGFQLEADMNQDGSFDLLDVQLFVDALAGG